MTQAVVVSQFGGVSPSWRNRIINGAMMISQRNGTSSITPSSGFTYSLDRWQYGADVGSKVSIQQNAGSVTPPIGFTKYLGITSLSAYTAGSTEQYNIEQKIEGFNIADLGFGTANAKTVTLSFWVYSSLTGSFSGSLLNSDGTRSYPFSYTISSANTWTQASVTIAGDTTGTWNTDNSQGMCVYFNLGCGSTFLGTAGAWTGSEKHGVTGSVSVVGTNGATFYITGVQLEVGSTATAFEWRPYGMELQLCQRYYQYWGGEANYGYFGGTASNISTTASFLPIIFVVPMRSAPSFTYVGALSAFDLRATNNASHTPTALAQDQTTSKVFGLWITTSGLTANTPGQMIGANSTAGQICFSAEL